MKRNLRKLILSTLAGLFLLSTAACNTIEGMGEDVERGGEELQEAAE